MSTRSVIAIPDGDGWKGRYCHCDGYPGWNGVTLQALVNRDGLEKVIQTLVIDNYGWSSLSLKEETLSAGRDDGRFKIVPGYGVAYTTEQGQSSPDEWERYEDVEKTWCEWAYVLTPAGIHVFESGEAWRPRGLVRYDDPDGMKAIEMAEVDS